MSARAFSATSTGTEQGIDWLGPCAGNDTQMSAFCEGLDAAGCTLGRISLQLRSQSYVLQALRCVGNLRVQRTNAHEVDLSSQEGFDHFRVEMAARLRHD